MKELNVLVLHGEQHLAGCFYRAAPSVFEAFLIRELLSAYARAQTGSNNLSSLSLMVGDHRRE